MRPLSIVALAMGVLALAVSASGCNTGGSFGSCQLEMMCIEYTGSGWDSHSIFSRCDGYGGEYHEGGCPAEDLVGSCIRERGDEREYVEYFYSPYFTDVASSEDCESTGGTWQET